MIKARHAFSMLGHRKTIVCLIVWARFVRFFLFGRFSCQRCFSFRGSNCFSRVSCFFPDFFVMFCYHVFWCSIPFWDEPAQPLYHHQNSLEKVVRLSPGDVIVKLVEAKHRTFRRAGVDLHTEVTITLREALLGFERNLSQLCLAHCLWKICSRWPRYAMATYIYI